MKNKYTIVDNVVLIETTANQVIKIDEASLPLLLPLNVYWSVVVNRQGGTGLSYARTKIKSCGVWLTRLMHHIFVKKEAYQVIDHINHDGLDNRLCNLRVVSASENTQRRRTGFADMIGIHQLPSGKWRAQVGFNYKIYQGEARLLPEEAQADRMKLIAQLYPTQIAPIV